MSTHQFRQLLYFTFLIVSFGAFVRMIIWWSDPIITNPISTKINTAFCIFLLNIQFVFIHKKFRSWYHFTPVAIAFIIGIISLVENIIDVNFGIDTILFFSSPSADFHLMSPATAVSILLLGITCVLLSTESKKRQEVGLFISYLVGANSLIVILANAFSLEVRNIPDYMLTESLLTATLFITIVLGISLAFYERGVLGFFLKSNSGIKHLKVGFITFLTLSLISGSTIITLVRHSLIDPEFGFVVFTALTFILLLACSWYFGRQLSAVFDTLQKINGELIIALDDNKMLMKELNHRVKNNLQIISSMLMIKAQQPTENIQEFLQETNSMISAFSTVHEQLLSKESIGQINAKKYLTNLSDNLIRSYVQKSHDYKLNLDIEEVDFDVNTMNAIGLIVSEIITNTIKYAYPDKNGPINISLHRSDNVYELKVSDQGIGLEKDRLDQVDSIGAMLIRQFVKHLNGELTVSSSNGTTYTIRFSDAASIRGVA